MLSDSQPRSSRGVSGDDPEGGARRGVLRRRLVTVRPGRRGTLPARHYDLAARSSLHGSGSCRRRKRGPRPTTATVERREASVPRHGELSFHGAPHKSTALRTTPHVRASKSAIAFHEPICYSAPLLRTLVGHQAMPKPRSAKLETPTARRRLEVRKKPYWTTISPGIHLGYRRNAGAGTWSVRVADSGA